MNELLIGIQTVFTFSGLLALVIGTALGIVVGALPGLGPSLGVALLIPITFSLEPSVGLNLLVSLYLAAEYGGSISAILIGTPGTAAATATVVDGYPMNKKGQGLKALQTSLIASTFGGVIGGIALVLLSQPLVEFALRFGPPEYFSLGVAGLTLIASLSGKEVWKGCAAGLLGLLLVAVGVDPISGTARFTFGYYELFEGIPFLVVLIGVFAVAEAFSMAELGGAKGKSGDFTADQKLSFGEMRSLLPTFLRGSIVGTVVGAIPGAGANIAGWFAYDQERRFSKHAETFGKGEIKGVAAPESANSASVGGALMPLLTLGLPGSPTTAVLLGAFVLHGLQPGPQLFQDRPDVIYGMLTGLMLAYVLVLVLGIAAMPLWGRVLKVPNAVLVPSILILSLIGAYSVRNLTFDIWLALGFGALGYVLKKFNFPMAPLVLAMVLGKIVEQNYVRSLIISHGDHLVFLERPLSIVLLAVAALSLFLPLFSSLARRRKGLDD